MFRSVLFSPPVQGSADQDPDGDLQPDLDADIDDTESTAPPTLGRLVCNQSVVFSQTFRVPTFYFTMHDSCMSYLSSRQLV